MLSAITSYLERRMFRLKLDAVPSREVVQETDVPQGGVLSVALFHVKVNSISRSLPSGVQYVLYVDGLQISVSFCNLSICERRLQAAMNLLQKWSEESGFRFPTDKTVSVSFTRKRGSFSGPCVTLHGVPIPVKKERKSFGLIFDSKLTFAPPIKELRRKCQITQYFSCLV